MTTLVRAHDVARTDRAHAAALLSPEVDATRALLTTLSPEDWRRPTDCPRWNVHDIVGHTIGNAENFLDADLFAQRVQEGTARYPELPRLDAMNEIAAEVWRERPDSELVSEFVHRWRQLLQALPEMPEQAREQRFDTGYPDVPPVELGYVLDVILARDMWMHRVDICRAAGRTFTPHDHDRGVVEQVLRDLDDEWAGPSFELELTGLVTGDWQIGEDAPVAAVEADALGLMRSLSGRADAEVTVRRGDAGTAQAVRSARVIF
ncbi:maleylpyruvate isomerase family mycothiol-dependent enzyme [Saccharopolyspora taberi]|uniref:Mycothiol-dependent maleylpyruvate isomerase metal-binding domain-containing protein n=1 Tax=Saccharopolyspora taberi TaxID=60895 RepID=A0ABN3VFB9_9PSEU